jgi:hypothetical protein
LRHQNAVLRRQIAQVGYKPANRIWIPLLSRARVAMAQHSCGGVDGDPGEQGGQVGEVVVDRGRRHPGRGAVAAEVAFSGQVVAPRGGLARGDSRDPVVAEPRGEPSDEGWSFSSWRSTNMPITTRSGST